MSKFKVGDLVKVLCDEGQPIAHVVYASSQADLDTGEMEYFVSYRGMVGPFNSFDDCLHFDFGDGDWLGLCNGDDLVAHDGSVVEIEIDNFDESSLTLTRALFK